MRLAAISDVHSNLAALEAVLRDLHKRNPEEVVFTGDAVGYGPRPNEATALVAAECSALVAGNHDWALLGLAEPAYFNPAAKAAIEWTGKVLADRTRSVLAGLPLRATCVAGEVLLVHSTPTEPEEWRYISGTAAALPEFEKFQERLCIIGHSHTPFIAELTEDGTFRAYSERAPYITSSRYIINAGSVGQPRDHDPRAAYVLIDGDSIEVVRVAYDIGRTQREMQEAALPEGLIERLADGY